MGGLVDGWSANHLKPAKAGPAGPGLEIHLQVLRNHRGHELGT